MRRFPWTMAVMAAGIVLAGAICPLSLSQTKPAGGDAGQAATPADMKPYTETIPVPGRDVKFDMVPMPGGKFVMGSPAGEGNRSKDEGPQFEVELEPFWIGKCEVTWDEYELWALDMDRFYRKARKAKPTRRDLEADAITRPTKPYGDHTFGMGGENRPAINMSQLSTKMYCKWLSAKTGRYYRLPTEAEWEYACRAGTKTAYSFGADPKKLDDFAWHKGNSKKKYAPVGKNKPNPWGLHDMHGNAAEWVLDQYSPKGYAQFAGKKAVNPMAAADRIHPRVARGGSWKDKPEMLRSAARRASSEDWSEQDPQEPKSIWWHTDAQFVGFRVVRPFRRPTAEEAARYDLDRPQKADLEAHLRDR